MIIKKKSEKEPKVDSVFGIKSVQIVHKTIVPQIVDKFVNELMPTFWHDAGSVDSFLFI